MQTLQALKIKCTIQAQSRQTFGDDAACISSLLVLDARTCTAGLF